MTPTCRPAQLEDLKTVCSILQEAATWLTETGQTLWLLDELSENTIRGDITKGHFHLFEINGNAVGTLKFQLEDELFWPDVPQSESAFVHRVAIRRAYSGQGLSTQMLEWAVKETRRIQRFHLRLDCVATRPKLRAIYENFGFTHRDDRHVGEYFVSRFQYDVTWKPS
ncbi:GNAT family N-acetyltransferase [Verrucomicrobia bacterium]|nr:GNAT family N-acetyltransferase [Verrucomicrobiota bacterium]